MMLKNIIDFFQGQKPVANLWVLKTGFSVNMVLLNRFLSRPEKHGFLKTGYTCLKKNWFGKPVFTTHGFLVLKTGF